MTRILSYLSGAALVVAALLEADRVPDASLRHRAYVTVLVLAAVVLAARLPFLLGAAAGRAEVALRAGVLAAVAADVFGGIETARGEAHPDSVDPAVSIVWTVMLSVLLVAILAVSARRLGVARHAVAAGGLAGAAAFALWALLCLMQPDVPQSNAPTVLALTLAAMAAIQWSSQRHTRPAHSAAAGLVAAATAALLSGVLIDVVLPHLGRWTTNSAPPWAATDPHAVHRLVDPVGILMLGTLLGLALLVTVLVAARDSTTTESPGTPPAAGPRRADTAGIGGTDTSPATRPATA